LSWANYMFPGVDDKNVFVTRRGVCTDEEYTARITDSEEFYSTDSNEDIFKPDTLFESFHRQAQTPISDRALLADFLMLWLKKCMVPTLPHEAISIDVVYPKVLLAHGRPLGLLPAMVSCIQSGLRLLTTQFCNVETEVDECGEDVLDRNRELKRTTPCWSWATRVTVFLKFCGSYVTLTQNLP